MRFSYNTVVMTLKEIIPGVQAEQMEDPCYPKHPEDAMPDRKKKGKIVSRSMIPSKEIRNRSRERNSLYQDIR